MTAGLSAERPFAGLRPFGFEDREYFFGREDQVFALFRLLDRSRFIAVVGSSGSGKSSLVRAGLLPLVDEESKAPNGRPWRFATFHPGDSPITGLTRALTDLSADPEGGDDPEDREFRRRRIARQLRSSSFGLIDAVNNSQVLRSANVLLVVDQFEELFRYEGASTEVERDLVAHARWRDETASFVQLLLEATRGRANAIYVLLTMRSDFIGDCAQFLGLPEAVSATQFLVPSLSRDQRDDVIRCPIAKAGAQIEPVLVERLLNDIGGELDQLPVLQHCLSRIWERATPDVPGGERRLTLAQYEAVGTITGALSQHADEVMASLPGLEWAVEQVFRALSEIDREGRATRRALPLAQLRAETGIAQDDLCKVLDRFREEDCSFLMPSPSAVPELADDTRIDVVHEALLRRWVRISAPKQALDEEHSASGWLAAEKADGDLYRALLTLVGTSGAADVTLPLDQVEKLNAWWRERPRTAAWAARYGGHLDRVEKLLSASMTALAEDRARQAEAQRQKLAAERRELEYAADMARIREQSARNLARRTQWFVAGATTLAVVAIAFALYAFSSAKAERAAEQGLQLSNNQLAEDKRTLLLRAHQMAIANAATRAAEEHAVRARQEADRQRNAAQQASRAANAAAAAAKRAQNEAIAQATAAKVARDDAIQSRNKVVAEQGQVFLRAGSEALSNGDADAAAVLLAGAYHQDRRDPALPPLLKQSVQRLPIAVETPGHRGTTADNFVTALTFGPGATDPHVAVARADGSVEVLGTGLTPAHKFNDQDLVTALAFDPSGRYLATASRDGSVVIHPLFGTGGSAANTVRLHGGPGVPAHLVRVNSVAFDRNGSYLLTGGGDGEVKLWSIPRGELVWRSGGVAGVTDTPDASINDATFSRDGKFVAAVTSGGALRVWPAPGGKPGQTAPKETTTQDPLLHVAAAPAGSMIAAWGEHGALLHDPVTGKTWTLHIPLDPRVRIITASFDTAGNAFALVNSDGSVYHFNTSALPASGGTVAADSSVRPAQRLAVTSAALSPRGGELAVAYADGSLVQLASDRRTVLSSTKEPGGLRAAAFSGNGNLLATGSDDGTLYLWNSSDPLEPLGSQGGEIATIAVGGEHALTASHDGTAVLWRVTGRPIKEHVLHQSSTGDWVVDAQFSTDGKRAITAGGNSVKVWDVDRGALLGEAKALAGKRFSAASFVGHSYRFVAAQTDIDPSDPNWKTSRWTEWSPDGLHKLTNDPYNAHEIRELRTTADGCSVLSVTGHGYAVFETVNEHPGCPKAHNVQWSDVLESALNNDGKFFLGTTSGLVRFVSPKNGEPIAEWQAQRGAITTLALSPDGRWLVTAGRSDGIAKVWDATAIAKHRKSRPVPYATMNVGASNVNAAAFSPDGAFLLTLSDDGATRVWFRESGALLSAASVPSSAATAAEFLNNGSSIMVGAENGNVLLWPLTPADSREAARMSLCRAHTNPEGIGGNVLLEQAAGVSGSFPCTK